MWTTVPTSPAFNPLRGTSSVSTTRSCSLIITDRKSTRLNSSHLGISYAVFCLKKKTHHRQQANRYPEAGIARRNPGVPGGDDRAPQVQEGTSHAPRGTRAHGIISAHGRRHQEP